MRCVSRDLLVMALFGAVGPAVLLWEASPLGIYRPLSLELASALYGGDGKTANDPTVGPTLLADCNPTGNKCETTDPCITADYMDRKCQRCEDSTLEEKCVTDNSRQEILCGSDCVSKLAYACSPTLTFTGACKPAIIYGIDGPETVYECMLTTGAALNPMVGTGCGGRTVQQCDPST